MMRGFFLLSRPLVLAGLHLSLNLLGLSSHSITRARMLGRPRLGCYPRTTKGSIQSDGEKRKEGKPGGKEVEYAK